MSGSSGLICCCSMSIINMIVLLACAVQVFIWSNEIESIMGINADFMNQVADDWRQDPYTNLTVTSGASCPSDHPKAVYDRVWHGMRHGCNCLGIYDRHIDRDDRLIEEDVCTHNETRAGCRNI